jgi:hypothetical protein
MDSSTGPLATDNITTVSGYEMSLAQRLGITTHVSPLLKKLERIRSRDPISGALMREDWLLVLANDRGAKSITPAFPGNGVCFLPDTKEFSNEELIAAICLPHNRDRPQWFRLAAELVVKEDTDLVKLKAIAIRERLGRILAELARTALRAFPGDERWAELAELDENHGLPLKDNLIHWSRLAKGRKTHAASSASYNMVKS